MAPDFEISQKLEIMRMISFFLPNLRLSAAGTPELRIAAHAHGYRKEIWFSERSSTADSKEKAGHHKFSTLICPEIYTSLDSIS